MKNLNNLGLVEMTEQEMREVNGGGFWEVAWELFGLYVQSQTGIDINRIRKAEHGMCVCDTLGCEHCPSCNGY